MAFFSIYLLSLSAGFGFAQPPGMLTVEANYNYAESNKDPASDPVITSWIRSTGIVSSTYSTYLDVRKVQYSKKYVYVSCSGLPSYSIGPWSNNNVAKNQDLVFQFPRVPLEKPTGKTAVSLSTVAVLINGVALYNAEDAQSISGWKRNAYYFERDSFDSCGGHPQNTGFYHNHVFPICMNGTGYNDSTKHSPIIGFANDGFPIYGPFGYSNASDPTSPIKRILSSFRVRSMTSRTTLASGAAVTGPSIATYPLGYFLDDFEYVSGLGDVDSSGGRWCLTPEYPNGTYAYFLPTDSSGNPAYPYTLGLTYFGYYISQNGASGKTAISESVTTYFTAGSGIIRVGAISLSLTFFILFKNFILKKSITDIKC